MEFNFGNFETESGLLDNGWYKAKVTSIESGLPKDEKSWNKPKDGKGKIGYLKFSFKILGTKKDKVILGFAWNSVLIDGNNCTIHQDKDGGKWLKAIFKGKMPKSLDNETIAGAECMVMIEQEERKDKPKVYVEKVIDVKSLFDESNNENKESEPKSEPKSEPNKQNVSEKEKSNAKKVADEFEFNENDFKI